MHSCSSLICLSAINTFFIQLIIGSYIMNSYGFIRSAWFRRPYVSGFSHLIPSNGGHQFSHSCRFVATSAKKLDNRVQLYNLRKLMKTESVDALIVPGEDPHMSEYVASCFNRREFVSGFTGSAGTVIITLDDAFLFTDGRYHQQAESELPKEGWNLMKQGLSGVPSPLELLTANLRKGSTVGIDPAIHSVATIRKYLSSFAKKNIQLKYLKKNLVDEIWLTDRPAVPSSAIRVHPLQYAGKSVEEKLTDVRKLLEAENSLAAESKTVDGLICSSLDEIMWLYNIRGSDVPFNPVSLCYALVTRESTYLFIDSNKISSEVKKYFETNNISVRPYDDILPFIGDYSKSHKIWYDSNTLNAAVWK
jgi:Xaa-Pro aminopeptidase